MPKVADVMEEKRQERIIKLVEDADYSKCSVVGKQEVDLFLVEAISAILIHFKGSSSNGNGKKDWKSLLWFMASKSPWAVACVMIVGMVIYASKMNWI